MKKHIIFLLASISLSAFGQSYHCRSSEGLTYRAYLLDAKIEVFDQMKRLIWSKDWYSITMSASIGSNPSTEFEFFNNSNKTVEMIIKVEKKSIKGSFLAENELRNSNLSCEFKNMGSNARLNSR